jgi:hypothetical protein
VLRRILLCESLENAASEAVQGFKRDLLTHTVHNPDGAFFVGLVAQGHGF